MLLNYLRIKMYCNSLLLLIKISSWEQVRGEIKKYKGNLINHLIMT
jgi:hypothetical protein